jgi:hypothetical protein
MSYIFALVHLQTIFSDHRPFFQSIDWKTVNCDII